MFSASDGPFCSKRFSQNRGRERGGKSRPSRRVSCVCGCCAAARVTQVSGEVGGTRRLNTVAQPESPASAHRPPVRCVGHAERAAASIGQPKSGSSQCGCSRREGYALPANAAVAAAGDARRRGSCRAASAPVASPQCTTSWSAARRSSAFRAAARKERRRAREIVESMGAAPSWKGLAPSGAECQRHRAPVRRPVMSNFKRDRRERRCSGCPAARRERLVRVRAPRRL